VEQIEQKKQKQRRAVSITNTDRKASIYIRLSLNYVNGVYVHAAVSCVLFVAMATAHL
jgi:hypothetical protein